MGKQLDKDMMKMMSITERFNYIAAKKKMMLDISSSEPDRNDDTWADNEDDDDDYSSRDDADSGRGGDYDDEYGRASVGQGSRV